MQDGDLGGSPTGNTDPQVALLHAFQGFRQLPVLHTEQLEAGHGMSRYNLDRSGEEQNVTLKHRMLKISFVHGRQRAGEWSNDSSYMVI